MIFTPSTLHHCSHGTALLSPFPETFSMLCWNVHKKNRTDRKFRPFLKKLMKEADLHLCLFQEAHFEGEAFILSDYAYDAAANMELNDTFYGVLTACKTPSAEAQAHLSQNKESLIGPRKSLLLTTYLLSSGRKLLVLNIHAINFRENRIYEKELEVLRQKVELHEGPMIIAGDFNAWNQTRTKILHQLRTSLSLEMVTFEKKDKIKSFMGYPLDFILYRGMHCLGKAVLHDHDISDHHPLFARFRIEV